MSKRKKKFMSLREAQEKGPEMHSRVRNPKTDSPQHKIKYLTEMRGWTIACSFGSPSRTFLYDPWGSKKFYSPEEAFAIEESRVPPTGGMLRENPNPWGVEYVARRNKKSA